MGTITVSNLGKAYKQYSSRWARLAEWIVPYYPKSHTLKWVLEDINFTIQPGEAVGIIGLNGAGKSTLLKLITGTAQPTTGSVHMVGRVAAMLELGMGFHQDFTGRQNALMAGQLLGYSVDEITQLMPEIEAFAEIGDYIDQPVRIYSSGMQMRLAFSVATAHRPDILIVDEALSVGDAYFVHKSFARIKAFSELGTTLLIVSHDKGAIQTICDRAILLSAGTVAMEGSPESVMEYYNAMLADQDNRKILQTVLPGGVTKTRSGTGEASIVSTKLVGEKGEELEHIFVGQKVSLVIEAKINESITTLILGYGLRDRFGQMVFGTNTHYTEHALHNLEAGSKVRFRINFEVLLGAGTYSVVTALTSTETHMVKNYDWIDKTLVFNVINSLKPEFLGSTWIEHSIETNVSTNDALKAEITK